MEQNKEIDELHHKQSLQMFEPVYKRSKIEINDDDIDN